MYQRELDLDTIKWPDPKIVREHHDLTVAEIKKNLTEHADRAWPGRLKVLVDALYRFALLLIPLANSFLSNESGAQKKQVVTATIVKLIEEVEHELDVLPVGVQTVVFALLRHLADAIVENAFKALEAQ